MSGPCPRSSSTEIACPLTRLIFATLLAAAIFALASKRDLVLATIVISNR
jgi:hypothetical protein